MKKKIPFSLLVSGVLLIFVLSLLWTHPAQGMPDPKRLKERPNQELKSPPKGDQFDDILLLIIPNWNGFSLTVCVMKDSPKENQASSIVPEGEVKSKTNNVKIAR